MLPGLAGGYGHPAPGQGRPGDDRRLRGHVYTAALRKFDTFSSTRC